jgi:ABC-type glutathione transport system ATPase component
MSPAGIPSESNQVTERPAETRSGKDAPLLEVVGVHYSYGNSGLWSADDEGRSALADISFQMQPGEVLGVLGENGSGKSTLARVLFQIARPTRGRVLFQGVDLTGLRGLKLQRERSHMQLVMQDPIGSLNPMWRVADLVEEPLLGFGIGDRTFRKRRAAEVLERVGLPMSTYGRRFPREMSGGQCQRVAIARSLAVSPRLLVLDEALSTLDALIQAELVRMLLDLREELGIGIMFVSHDLHLVRCISDRVAVLFQGRLCEVDAVASVFSAPSHPYTRNLLAAS